MKDFGGLMKQAQQMQQKMQQMQEDVKNLEVVGESGAGLVKVTMTGRHDVKKISIDSSLASEELEITEDLVAAAVNDAVRKVEVISKEKMKSMAGGIDLPPGFNLGL